MVCFGDTNVCVILLVMVTADSVSFKNYRIVHIFQNLFVLALVQPT